MSNKAHILVIDDEIQIRKLLEITLQSNDYGILLAGNAADGIVMAAQHQPDMIILDLGLPDEDGHIVLKKLRDWFSKPVIILSAQTNVDDIVMALDNGANDYLIKPFRTGELLARIRSALRTGITKDDNTIICGNGLNIDLAARLVRKNNVVIKLTATEYTLLALLARNEGKVLTHHYLLREVWGHGYLNQSQYLRVFIAQLRKKIETDPNRPVFIITESGVGYRFVIQA